MYRKMEASGLTISTSALWGQILFPPSPLGVADMADSCFLHSSSSSAITLGSGDIWIGGLGALIHIWRPEIIGGCNISSLLKWQIFSFQKTFCTFYAILL